MTTTNNSDVRLDDLVLTAPPNDPTRGPGAVMTASGLLMLSGDGTSGLVDVIAAWIDAQVRHKVDAEIAQRASADLIVHLPLRTVLGGWRNGDETTWAEEFVQLAIDEAEYIRDLSADVVAHGIKEPILLGADGRVWDGHHRLLVAMHLGLDEVPCRLTEQIGATAPNPTGDRDQ